MLEKLVGVFQDGAQARIMARGQNEKTLRERLLYSESRSFVCESFKNDERNGR
jgi:hypothetical protein